MAVASLWKGEYNRQQLFPLESWSSAWPAAEAPTAIPVDVVVFGKVLDDILWAAGICEKNHSVSTFWSQMTYLHYNNLICH